jgi:hypothetical protein
VFPGKSRAEQRAIAELKAKKQVRSIGPRLYARTSVRDVASVVRSQWAQIVSRLFPDAVISHRSALEYKPTPDGDVFLTSGTNRVVKYPGLTLRFHRGPGALPDDVKFLGTHASSPPRALLENLATVRGTPRNVPIEDVEQRLEQILRDTGEEGLGAFRDHARKIARKLSWKKEMDRLDTLIGTLLGTRSGVVTSAIARARVAGEPYDERCLDRLQTLFAELRGRMLPDRRDRYGRGEHFSNKAFFEAYFSNYIEGTELEIEVAERIVFDGDIPPRRPQDAHDVAGTYAIVSDPNEMKRTPVDYETLRDLLVARHARIMASRPEIGPGEFKQITNRAGDTIFVHPDYVVGTLRRGVELLVALPEGIARAIFVMSLVADVHPFNDGNGRIARIMMNCELVARSSATIIIPTAYRDEYIDTLRALTRQHRPGPIVTMLLRAQELSNLDFSDYPAIKKQLEANNWFKEPGPAKLIF